MSSKRFLLISIFVFLLCTSFRFLVSNYYAEKTDEFNNVNKEIISIKNEISNINIYLYEQSSIKNLEQRALKYGFAPMDKELNYFDSATLARSFRN